MTAAGLAVPPPDDGQALELVMTMISALSPLGQAEAERALTLHLRRLPEKWEQRVGELFFLSQLVEQHGRRPATAGRDLPRGMLRRRARGIAAADDPALPALRDRHAAADGWPGVPTVSRDFYDERRPDGITTSQRLVERYGSWLGACRAAYGLQPDGRHTGPGRSWARPAILDNGRRLYTVNDCLAAIRACATALQRLPTTTDYVSWRAARLSARPTADRRRLGLPTIDTINAHCGPWRDAISKARIDPDELAAARASRVPSTAAPPTPPGTTAEARLLALSPADLAELGITAERRDKLAQRGCGTMPLREAVTFARVLDGSLDWLAGRSADPNTAPPASLMLDRAVVGALRAKKGLSEESLRGRLRLPLGRWRRMLNGSADPALDELAKLADLLGTTIDALLRAPQESRR